MKHVKAVIMGVSGCGKSTLGRALAEKTGGVFIEGDEFHPPENVAKMSAGTPLTDADRAGWLATLADELRRSNEAPTFLACSALKESYREILQINDEVTFIYLHGSAEQLHARLESRKGHFMPASLLNSQLETLEAPEDAIRIEIDSPLEEMVEQVLRQI